MIEIFDKSWEFNDIDLRNNFRQELLTTKNKMLVVENLSISIIGNANSDNIYLQLQMNTGNKDNTFYPIPLKWSVFRNSYEFDLNAFTTLSLHTYANPNSQVFLQIDFFDDNSGYYMADKISLRITGHTAEYQHKAPPCL